MMTLDLVISTDWARIAMVRQAVRSCVMAVFHDHALGQDMAMSSAELLENAVKYGTGEQVKFSLTRVGNELEITVANEADPASGGLTRLRGRLQWINGFADPSAAYAAAVDAAGLDEQGEMRSGLGLVRIVCEGGLKLHLDESSADRVVMRARRQLPPSTGIALDAGA